MDASAQLALLQWRREIFELYARLRAADEPRAAWVQWRATRDCLFAGHPASPIPPARRAGFSGLRLFDFDPTVRVCGEVADVEDEELTLATSDGSSYPFTRFARVRFELYGLRHELEVFRLHGYGGGLFVPFSDATNGDSTYGAGRYLLDTVKGADLGGTDGRLILDFNFAYNPSCSYDPEWSCPLPSGRNRLDAAVRAGERTPG